MLPGSQGMLSFKRMTYQDLEARALALSKLGYKIRLYGSDYNWSWEWQIGGLIVNRQHTDAKEKAAALYLALTSF